MLFIYFISLISRTYLVIVAFHPSTSYHISGDDEHDNNDENVIDYEDEQDHQDMPRVTTTAPTAAAATTATKKPTTGAKTSGETKADYPPSSVRTISRIYGLGTEDKYTITEVSEGNADFYIIGFIVDGVLPEEGGYQCTLSKNGFTLSWSRPVDSLLFNFKHLQPIMGQDYSESHARVQAFDKQVTQSVYNDKIEPDSHGYFWGEPQKIHLKHKCTGTPETFPMIHPAPPIVNRVKWKRELHKQFRTIITCRVQLAERRKSAPIKAKTEMMDLYASSQGTTPSPGERYRRSRSRRERDFGGSHREYERPSIRTRVSSENDESDGGGSRDY